MSHLTTVKTKYKDVDALKTALEKLGFEVTVAKYNLLEIKNMYGQLYDKKCCVKAVMRNDLPAGTISPKKKQYGEMGFSREADGTLVLIADHMDVELAAAKAWCPRYTDGNIKPWAKALPKAYSYEVTMAMIRRKGYAVAMETTDATGQIHVRVQRRN